MNYFQCPDTRPPEDRNLTVFLGGGITGCPGWQDDVVQLMAAMPEFDDITLVNPRRQVFDHTIQAQDQIKWEHEHLRRSDIVLFWFPSETLCPITLFELGKYASNPSYKVFVGIHPEYQRRIDLEIQIPLISCSIPIVYDILSLVSMVKQYKMMREQQRDTERKEWIR